VRAIAHQQLNGRAAETILGRFVALFPERRFPAPAAVLAAHAATLRRAGFSRAKVRAIKDIAGHAVKGMVPTRRACRRLSDEEMIERRSEEHTSELQSRGHLVCRLLLEKKKKQKRK